MKHLFTIRILFVLLLALSAINIQAQLVVNQDFTGATPGNSVTAPPPSWGEAGTGISTFLIANSSPLTYPTFNGGGGNYVQVTRQTQSPPPSPNHVVGKTFSPTASTGTNTFYYSFLLNVSGVFSQQNFITLDKGLNDGSFFAKLWIQQVGASTTLYNLGIGKAGGAGTPVFKVAPTTLAAGTTYLIVVRYTFNGATTTDDQMYLWINPVISSEPSTATAEVSDVTSTDAPATPWTNAGVFVLRESTLFHPNYSIDGIRVAYGATSAAAWTNLDAFAANNNAYLSNLTISKGTLTPAFQRGNTSYTDAVLNDVTSLTVTPTAEDPGATITVNGLPVASGSPSQSIPLVVGNNPVTIVVTAADKVTTKTYTIIVNRGAAGNNWYVNDNSTANDRFTLAVGNDATGTGTQAAPFATINKAMTAAANGDIIWVDAGAYGEYVNITKSLRFYGANYDVSPNNVATPRVTESVITAQAIPTVAGGPTVFEASTPGVTTEIKGFKLQAGSPLRDGDVHRSPTQDINIVFEKNYVSHGNNLFAGTLTRWQDVTIRDNLFENIDFTSNNSTAIQLNDAVTGASGPHAATVTTTIEDNVINTTTYAGILLDNIATASIQRNKVNNVPRAGIQMAGGMGNATVNMNEVSNANTSHGADYAGIRIYGSAFTGATNITNNTVTGSWNGFAVRTGEAISNPNIHVNNNSFDATNANRSIFHGGIEPGGVGGSGTPQPFSLDAECNWHGVSAGAGARITGPVDYINYLNSGADSDPATIGFQPAAGSCTVSTPATLLVGAGEDNVEFKTSVRIYPVPVLNTMKVEYTSNENAKLNIVIVDQAGRILQKEIAEVIKGVNTIEFNVRNLRKGIYTVLINDGTKQSHQKMIKM